MLLLGAIVTIIVVFPVMAELGAEFERSQSVAPAVPAATLLVGHMPVPAHGATETAPPDPPAASQACPSQPTPLRPRPSSSGGLHKDEGVTR